MNHDSPAGNAPKNSPLSASPGSRSGRFFPDKLPRLLLPYGTLTLKRFVADSLKVILPVLVLLYLPEILYSQYADFFDSLSGPGRTALLLADRASNLILLAFLSWVLLCLYIRRLRDAGMHWSLAVILCGGSVGVPYYWPGYVADLASMACFLIVVSLPSRQTGSVRPTGPAGRSGE